MSESEIVANDIQAAQLLNDQWKLRHQHCWKILNRFGLTGLTVALIPYIQMLDIVEKKLGTLVERLGNWELFFPLAAWIIAQAAVYLFKEEYIRCRPYEAKCNFVLARKKYNAFEVYKSEMKTTGWKRFLQPIRSVGQSTIFVYSSFASLFTFFSIRLLIEMGVLKIEHNPFWIIGGTLCIFFIGIAYYFSYSSGERIREIIEKQEKDEQELNSISIDGKSEIDILPELSSNTSNALEKEPVGKVEITTTKPQPVSN